KGTANRKRKTSESADSESVGLILSRAARAFGEYLSNTNLENRNRAEHLLSNTLPSQDCESPDIHLQNNNLPLQSHSLPVTKPSQSHQSNPSSHLQPRSQVNTLQASAPLGPSKRRLSVEQSLSTEDPPRTRGPEGSAAVKPARVYTITREGSMNLGDPGSEESLELEVLKSPRNHHRTSHHHTHQHHWGRSSSSQPLQSSKSASNIGDWGRRRGGSREDYTPDCVACIRAPCQRQRSLDLDTSPRDTGKHCKKLERMYSEDRTSTDDREENLHSSFPQENTFSFQTATTTMQADCFTSNPSAFVNRRAKSFSRSWSDPTPVKPDSTHDSRSSGELQTSSGIFDEVLDEDVDWEEEREMERAACEGEDFIPPKIMLISSKVPKAEYVPNIILRDDSIIPILYDHEHATFDDILEDMEKKLTAYRKGCKIWKMLIFCQGGPGHLYLLKNKVATFAKVEKEEDMVQFWRRLGKLMSRLNPEPNLIHIMGCYVLGSANGEKVCTKTEEGKK
uniref:NMDA receptor synaptonuclear signaling and neuronal migration factor b n=1 Tax=Kryptolebias marmoratus TaxID=37003 RepID=A0A3Q3A2X0_KRYMA